MTEEEVDLQLTVAIDRIFDFYCQFDQLRLDLSTLSPSPVLAAATTDHTTCHQPIPINTTVKDQLATEITDLKSKSQIKQPSTDRTATVHHHVTDISRPISLSNTAPAPAPARRSCISRNRPPPRIQIKHRSTNRAPPPQQAPLTAAYRMTNHRADAVSVNRLSVAEIMSHPPSATAGYFFSDNIDPETPPAWKSPAAWPALDEDDCGHERSAALCPKCGLLSNIGPFHMDPLSDMEEAWLGPIMNDSDEGVSINETKYENAVPQNSHLQPQVDFASQNNNNNYYYYINCDGYFVGCSLKPSFAYRLKILGQIRTADVFKVKYREVLITFAFLGDECMVGSIILLDIKIHADSRTNLFEEGENDGDKEIRGRIFSKRERMMEIKIVFNYLLLFIFLVLGFYLSLN